MIKLSKNETILFIGDSITDGNHGRNMDPNHLLGHGYQEMIAAKLICDNYKNMPKFINKGISGNNSGQILARLNDDCLCYKPDIINILCGVNDCCYGGEGNTDESALNNLDTILAKIKETLPNTKIVLCEPFYMDVRNQENRYENLPNVKCEDDFFFSNNPLDLEKVEKFSSRMKRLQNNLPSLAKKYGCIFVPLQDIFDEASKDVPASYFIWDNVHPTIAGHTLMAKRWLDVVEKTL